VRLPNEAQLSREQKEVCFAPTDKTILVTGPPGSGKTVIAIFRQNALKKQRKKVQTLVFNHVLKRYTAIDSTFYAWLSDWWRQATGCSFPRSLTQAGGMYDFDAAAAEARGRHKGALAERGDWGHVILDEAQDFAKMAHEFLFVVRELVFAGKPIGKKPSMTILADENQRLTETNSTIGEILGAHLLSDDQIYHLRRNYRNTRQIALLAAAFYTGLPTGVPELPARLGDKPRLVVTDDIDEAVQRIVSYVKLHENQDVGVLVFNHWTRKKLFNKLSYRLRDTAVSVQTYTSDKDDKSCDPTSLEFDVGGSVTVLCFASGKGLEFDAVFLAELQALPVNDQNILWAKMNLYVMCSRARDALFLLVSDPERQNAIWRLLPHTSDLVELEESTRAAK
jgi:DNA helicase II / ATP-dependent DNA helicase PcrA